MWSFDDPANRSYIDTDWFTGSGGGGDLMGSLMGGMGMPSLSSSSNAQGGYAGDSGSGDFFGNVTINDKGMADIAMTALPYLAMAGLVWLYLRNK